MSLDLFCSLLKTEWEREGDVSDDTSEIDDIRRIDP